MLRWIMLSVAALVFVGCGQSDTDQNAQSSTGNTANNSGSAQPPGFDSPEAVFAAVQKAAADEDFAGVMTCMDAESQEMFAMMMTLPLAMIAAFDPDKGEEVNKLLSKHGVSLEDESEDFPIKTTEGRIAYVTEVMEWMKASSDDPQQKSDAPFTNMVEATLSDVTIEGDIAKATFTAEGETEEIEFKQIDGKWYLHLPAPEFDDDGDPGE